MLYAIYYGVAQLTGHYSSFGHAYGKMLKHLHLEWSGNIPDHITIIG